jgi:hypothetical protein
VDSAVSGETVFSRYLNKNGEGAVALIHKVKNASELSRNHTAIGPGQYWKNCHYTLETKTGDLIYTIMDTREKGKYYLGFVIDERSDATILAGKNHLNMRFNQYAFAIENSEPVSDFWVSADCQPWKLPMVSCGIKRILETRLTLI